MIIIILNNLSRMLKNKLNIIFMILVPVVMITFVMNMGSSEVSVNCGVVDLDNTEFTKELIKTIGNQGNIKLIEEGEINKELVNQTLDCAILIEKDFTKKLIEGSDVNIKSYSLQETNVSAPFMVSVNSYLNSAHNISLTAKGNSDMFYSGMEYLKNGSFEIDLKKVENSEVILEKLSIALGFLVMGMLFLSSFAPMIMIKDKETKVFYRVISTPITMKKYMFANIISFFIISVIQIGLIFFFLINVVKADLGPSALQMFILSLVFSLTCTALGVAINTIAKDSRQSSVISSLILSPLCMLGGCWWSIEMMPDVLQRIANFVPTTWIMRGYSKVLHGTGLTGVINEILVLFAFTLIFFLLGSWRKAEIAK